MFEMSLTYDDIEPVENAVNLGIDSRLEGFVKSEFEFSNETGVTRLNCNIHEDELQILIRRLLEGGDLDGEMLADTIVYVQYGYETV